MAFSGSPSTGELTQQFKKIDPTVSGVSKVGKDYKVTYKDGTTNTLTSQGLKDLQSLYRLPSGTYYDDSGPIKQYIYDYRIVTPEDIARYSKGYVAPKASTAQPVSDTTLVSSLPSITPFKPSVPAFNFRGGAPYAGLAALPAARPVSLVQMPTEAPVLAPTVQTIGAVPGMRKGGLASTADRLASKGRGGDSMLVHMNPEEVAGLQALARQHGTSLTINPETGLPEALSLKKVFKAALPVLAGFALGPAGAGLFSSGITAGLTVGGLTALSTGSFEKGLAAGLGAYGGFGLSQGASAAAAASEQEALRQAAASGSSVGTVAPSAGGVSAGTVGADFVGPTITGAPPTAGGFSFGSEGEFLVTGAEGAPIAQNATLAQQMAATPTPDYIQQALAPKTAAMTPMDAFNAQVGYPEYGALYAGSVAMPAAIEEAEKFKQEQALLVAQEEEKKRRYRELFESTLGQVPTRMARSGGLMNLAKGGMTYMEAGGTTGLTGMPRDVKGTGDGMSDSVPATIEGVQEARLADGEFVIPADVVADIGNGSSNAGSKKLYDMMARIRDARHGTTKQPPEIDAEALMPA